MVTVKNHGLCPAEKFSTEVDFFEFGKVSMPTMPLVSGAMTELLYDLPIPSDFVGTLEFRITVDREIILQMAFVL